MRRTAAQRPPEFGTTKKRRGKAPFGRSFARSQTDEWIGDLVGFFLGGLWKFHQRWDGDRIDFPVQ